jgi:hypothetical protein
LFAAIRSHPATDSARRRPDRPSVLCRALFPLLLIVPCLVGAAAPAAADSIALAAVSADADSLTLPVPRSALIRSALLPGWGQLYNHKPFKATFFAATSAGLLGASISAQRSLGDALTPLEHEDRAARRNTRLLYFALSVTFSALDAYVDAHLADFAAGEEVVSLIPRADGVLLSLHLNW